MFAALYGRVLDIIFPESVRVGRVRADSGALPLEPHVRTVGRRSITVLSSYNEKRVEDAICSVKFERSRVGVALLAAMLDDYLEEHLAEKSLFGSAPTFVVPVPLGAKRKATRGENQVVMVLKEIRAVRNGRLTLLECLLRLRETKPQTTLARAERLLNVRGAFSVLPAHAKSLRGAHVLLVDDVTTTGATLSEAASALEEVGAAVECLALAG